MKNVLILIGLVLMVAFTTKSQAAQKKIIGELVNEGDRVTLYTRDGRYSLETDGEVEDCFEGEYTVRPSNKGQDVLELVETVFCRGKGKGFYGSMKNGEIENNNSEERIEDQPVKKELIENKTKRCPNVYAPVCGLYKGAPETFQNICELKKANAQKLFFGECQGPINQGFRGHQENHKEENLY